VKPAIALQVAFPDCTDLTAVLAGAGLALSIFAETNAFVSPDRRQALRSVWKGVL